MPDSARLAGPPRVPGLELLDKIGEGGTGVVYRAVNRNLDRTVAVKVLRADGAPGWLRESRLTAALAHPNVVGIHDAGATDGNHYLVLEFMAGGSLRGRMTPGRPWPPADAVALVAAVAGALDHIHRRGVLHLDLKPENILFGADDGVKVSDFGLAIPEEDAGDLLGGLSYPGTADYAAPERRSGLAPDARYDVFSLATLAYELLTGRLPGRAYVPATARNPGLPPAVDAVLRRGLAREPEDRYASVAEFRDALAAACGPPRARPRRRRLLAVALGAAVALAAVAGTVAALRRPAPVDPGPEPAGPAAPAVAPPDRAWVLYAGDPPEGLALFAGDVGVPVERARVGPGGGRVPDGVPLPFPPAPLPALVVRSPGAWGFVHPLADPGLGRRVVSNWAALAGPGAPPGKNLVRAGGFDGDCLKPGGGVWRWDDRTGTPDRKVEVADPPDRPGDPALRLTAREGVGCYQPLADPPAGGSVLVLRYRARAGAGARVSVYADLVAAAPHRAPGWVKPGPEWRTYLVATEVPPGPRGAGQKVIAQAAGGEAWVDDVELFALQPGGAP